MTAQHETLGVPTGGPVEGLGDRGPPIDHQRVVIGAVDGQAADVEGLDGRFAAVAAARLPSAAARPSGRRRRRRAAATPSVPPIPPWRLVDRSIVDPVDPAEGQGLVPDVQLFEPGQAGAHDHVPFGPRLERSAPPQVEHPLEHGIGITPHGVEACVGHVHERLFSLKL